MHGLSALYSTRPNFVIKKSSYHETDRFTETSGISSVTRKPRDHPSGHLIKECLHDLTPENLNTIDPSTGVLVCLFYLLLHIDCFVFSLYV